MLGGVFLGGGGGWGGWGGDKGGGLKWEREVIEGLVGGCTGRIVGMFGGW